MARRRSRSRRSRLGFVSILLLFGVLSIVEFLETGTLQWPGKLAPVAEELLADEVQVQVPPAERDANPSGRASPTSSTTPVDAALTGQAVNITDGDTFTLRYSSLEEERVRLHGIDAPERNQPHGPAAGAELARLIEGREVRVELVDRDNYGRLVARVWIGDLDINLALVEGGHAWWYEYYAQDRRDLELAEEAARRAQLGLWAQRNPVPPWEWRRNRR